MNMERIDVYLKILFLSAKPERIKTSSNMGLGATVGDLSYNAISKDLFMNYAREYLGNKTDNEINLYFNHLLQHYHEKQKYEKQKNVFDYLIEFGEKTISLQNNIPHVRFEHVLEWRDVTHLIDQTNVISAYLAKTACLQHNNQTFFDWPTVLRTDNLILQNILNKGISENHYHLNGSTQVFPVSWVCMMNHPEIIEKRVKRIRNNLMPFSSFGKNDNRQHWKDLLLEAAKIRLNLFCSIHPEYDSLKIKEDCLFLSNLISSISVIHCNEKILGSLETAKMDYAFTKEVLNLHTKTYRRILLGERKLLYDCFLKSFTGRFSETENNMLYKYILIKNNFRTEMVQCNNNVGFKNFQNYQDRKSYFINRLSNYETEALFLSINDVLHRGNIRPLEARIMTRKTVKELLFSIEIYDKVYSKRIEGEDDKTEKGPFYFVVHYPKGITPYKQGVFNLRNSKQRLNNKRSSAAIMRAIQCMRWKENRILGIDTCSNEIGCRPEVFATEYRLMKSFCYDIASEPFTIGQHALHIGRTYHVGEDFLDIADGLRAIDEVIQFLDFSHGDRLGHGLALGQLPHDYYSFKGYRLVLPQQVLLDDLVWIYCKAGECNLIIPPVLHQNMLTLIRELSLSIYGSFITETEIYMNPEVLYNAWKLRGDHPSLYQSMHFVAPVVALTSYQNAMFKYDSELQKLRENECLCKLNYAYYYDDEVRKKGDEEIEYKITEEYISLIEKLQKEMQYVVAKKDIMIECNPSSNYLIGTFKSYGKHPITTFNNMGLENDLEELQKCPQISVSINTDDQGVFDTSLEYEYALIAAGLLERRKPDGSAKYSPIQVYNYLDNVRKMGNAQSFIGNPFV